MVKNSAKMNMSAQIELLVKEGKSAAMIFKLLKPMVSRSGVYKVLKRLRETGSASPRVRSTPKSKIRTPRLVKTIRQKMRRNPSRSVTQLAKEAGIKRGTMRNVIKKDLGMRPFKKTKRQLISAPTRAKRLMRAKLLRQQLQSASMPPVVWSDEKLFTVQAIHNSQNDRVYGKNLQEIPVETRTAFRRQKPASIMVWAAVTSDGHKSPLIFIPEGVKINQVVYKDMLESQVLPWLLTVYNGDPFVFQQDEAPSHTAKKVQTWCKENFPGFWGSDLWPPSSPDLNPMDFSIWSILEREACSTYHKSISSLKSALVRAWDRIDADTIRGACGQVPDRLRRVIAAKGGYCEN